MNSRTSSADIFYNPYDGENVYPNIDDGFILTISDTVATLSSIWYHNTNKYLLRRAIIITIIKNMRNKNLWTGALFIHFIIYLIQDIYKIPMPFKFKQEFGVPLSQDVLVELMSLINIRSICTGDEVTPLIGFGFNNINIRPSEFSKAEKYLPSNLRKAIHNVCKFAEDKKPNEIVNISIVAWILEHDNIYEIKKVIEKFKSYKPDIDEQSIAWAYDDLKKLIGGTV